MLEEKNKKQILEILLKEFQMHEEIHMAAIGKYLHEQNMGPEVFGYKKMKKYLQDLKEIMNLQERIMNGVPQTIIVLHEYEEQNIPQYSDLQIEQMKVKKEEKPKETEMKNGFPVRLQEFAFIPNKVLAHLEQMVSDKSMENRDVMDILEEAYEKAVDACEFMSSEKRIQMNTGMLNEKKEPIYVTFSPNKLDTQQKWALTYVYVPKKTVKEKEVILKTEAKTENKTENKTETKQEASTDMPLRMHTHALEKDVLFPDKTVNVLYRYVKTEMLRGMKAKEFILDAYDRACQQSDVIREPDMFSFPLYIPSLNGEALQAVCRINKYPNQQKWALTYIGSRERKLTPATEMRKLIPGAMLEAFAEIGDWKNTLKELAEMALPEQWDFAVEKHKEYYILRQYLCYTFYRLQKEGKICISAGGDFAAFNTGLVSRMYEDIYACMVPNDEAEIIKWKLDGFCVAGERGNGKLLVKYFSPLPQAAKYFDELKDLLYDPERPLIADYNHILIENIDRLPMEFIRQECFSDKKAAQLASRAGAENNLRNRKRICQELAEYISRQPRLVTRLRNRLDDAIELAIKQCRWNYKTAIPLYYPKGNCMSLMLPLSFLDDEKADVAFVVQLTESGNYQGQTILTLPQAYLDARLLCRLNNEWLNTEKAIGFLDIDDLGPTIE